MSNKKKRFARKNKPSTQLGGVHSGLFEKMLPNIKAYILRAINSLEQRTNNLKIMIEEVKGNVVALTSVLEKTKMIRREDYMKEFNDYEEHVRGKVKKGKMVGNSIISIYNCNSEDSNESS